MNPLVSCKTLSSSPSYTSYAFLPLSLQSQSRLRFAAPSAIGSSGQPANGQPKFLGNAVTNVIPSNYDTYWNQITPGNAGKWDSVEHVQGTIVWTYLDLAHDHAVAKGFKFKLHNLVWGFQYLAWITTLSTTDQRTIIEA